MSKIKDDAIMNIPSYAVYDTLQSMWASQASVYCESNACISSLQKEKPGKSIKFKSTCSR